MTDSTKNETSQGNENPKNASDSKPKPRFLRGCLRFCFFVALAFFAFGFYLYLKLSAPIDAPNASTVQAVGWLALRDLSQESPQTREELFQMYTGGGSLPDLESGTELKLPVDVQKLAASFIQDREKRLQARGRSLYRAPYLRLDYLVAPRQTSDRSSRFVVSNDVQPGPSLKKRWTLSRSSAERVGASEKSIVEKNVHLLVMQWFVARMKEYDSTPDERKRQKLETVADELTRTQELYNKIRGLQRALTRVQTLREFEATMESWNEFSSVEELAKTLWFKDLLISVVASKSGGFGGNAALYPPLLPAKYRPNAEKESDAQKSRRNIVEKSKPICVAVRNYFFDDAK